MSTTEPAAPAGGRGARGHRVALTAQDLQPAYDHVVVGGGAGGCVLARRLAEAGRSVLLIEAGPTDVGREVVADPARWVETMGGELDWGLSYAPSPRLGGRTVPIPRGRVLGGSSSTNAMLWYRGHPCDYDRWVDQGAQGWGWRDCLPFFLRAEDTGAGGDELHGVGGPLRLERPADPHPLATALLGAAADLGMAVLADSAGPDPEGGAPATLNVGDGRRWSTARGYLRPDDQEGVDLGSLTVLTGSTARRLVVEGARCRGVEHLVDGRSVVTASHGDVVLAAGAVETPRLLLASGVGDPADLRRLGVPTRTALPGVGANLQDHPLLTGVNFAAVEDLGPTRDNGGGAVVNWRSHPGAPAPDVHVVLVQGVHALPEIARRYGIDPSRSDVFALSPGLMGSRSRGRATYRSLDAGGAVDLDPGLLTEPADVDALVAGLALVGELAATASLRPLVRAALSPPGPLARRAAQEFVARSTSTFFHPCGTAAMGSGPDAVLDPRLRVRGLEGVRVADASAFPSIPTCNTQAPVVMVAERAASMVLEDA